MPTKSTGTKSSAKRSKTSRLGSVKDVLAEPK